MLGTRLFAVEGEDLVARIAKLPGSYGRKEDVWYACTPTGLFANLRRHKVTEHVNGTITVEPAILVTTGYGPSDPKWHGYLAEGVWRTYA